MSKMKLPNGMGSIELINNSNRRKRYRVRKTVEWNENGTQIRKTIGYAKDWHEGYKMLIEYNDNPYDLDIRNMTFEEWFKKWIENQKKKGVKRWDKNDYSLKHCYNIKDVPIIELKTTHFQKVIDDMNNLAYETKKIVKSSMKQTVEFAIKNDAPILQNYVEYIELGEATKSEQHIPFTKEEKQKLWDNLNIGFIDLIIISNYTGLRPNELLNIKTESIFLDKKYMRGGSKTTAGKDRVIPMHEKIIPLINKWFDSDNKYLFTLDDKKIKYDKYLEMFKLICAKLDFQHLPYDCRHTCATDLDNKEANEVCKRLILGHAMKDITSRVYTHKQIGQLIETINLLD